LTKVRVLLRLMLTMRPCSERCTCQRGAGARPTMMTNTPL
jgi:hypothetical protein